MENPKKIITRKEAKELGLGRYFTGKPCKYGHIDERLTSNGFCFECARIKNRASYSENPEKQIAAARAWNVANKDQYNLRARERWAEDPTKKQADIDAYRSAYPERVRQTLRDCYKRNPAPYKQRATQRNYSLQQEYDSLNENEQKRVDDIYAEMNRLNERDGPRSWHVDHIHPRKYGGAHHPDNLQILSAEENLKKGAKVDPDTKGKRSG